MEYLLTFEIEDEILKIHGSPEGLKNLGDALEKLIKNTKKGSFDHTHFMENSNFELTLDKQSENSEIINHVKIYCWNV